MDSFQSDDMNGSEADVLVLPRFVSAAGGSDFNLGFLCRAGLSPFHLSPLFNQDLRPKLRTIPVIISSETSVPSRWPRMMCLVTTVKHDNPSQKHSSPAAEKAKNARAAVIIRFICKVCARQSCPPRLGSRRAKPATAECGSTGWISSRTTMLGILGSNVDLVSAQVGKRGNSEGLWDVPDRSDRRLLWLWREQMQRACQACMRGG